jgi:hypothetical protein
VAVVLLFPFDGSQLASTDTATTASKTRVNFGTFMIPPELVGFPERLSQEAGKEQPASGTLECAGSAKRRRSF